MSDKVAISDRVRRDDQAGAISEHAVVRAYGYKLFSALFAEPPSASTMDLAASEETAEVLSSLIDSGELDSYRCEVEDWTRLGADAREAWLDRQEGVFNKLFVGPGHLVAPPWESVYSSEDGLLFQRETLDVRGFYRRSGLAVPEQGRQADDHIAFELDYMFHEAVRDDAESLDAQRRFVNAHLLAWVPLFVERMRGAGSGFYAAVGGALLAFLKADARWLATA